MVWKFSFGLFKIPKVGHSPYMVMTTKCCRAGLKAVWPPFALATAVTNSGKLVEGDGEKEEASLRGIKCEEESEPF